MWQNVKKIQLYEHFCLALFFIHFTTGHFFPNSIQHSLGFAKLLSLMPFRSFMKSKQKGVWESATHPHVSLPLTQCCFSYLIPEKMRNGGGQVWSRRLTKQPLCCLRPSCMSAYVRLLGSVISTRKAMCSENNHYDVERKSKKMMKAQYVELLKDKENCAAEPGLNASCNINNSVCFSNIVTFLFRQQWSKSMDTLLWHFFSSPPSLRQCRDRVYFAGSFLTLSVRCQQVCANCSRSHFLELSRKVEHEWRKSL